MREIYVCTRVKIERKFANIKIMMIPERRKDKAQIYARIFLFYIEFLFFSSSFFCLMVQGIFLIE